MVDYRLLEIREKLFLRFRGDSDSDDDSSTAEYRDEWDRLHQHYAEQVQRTILKLRGFFVKYGQFLCARNDTLPQVYVDRLKMLEDQVPPMPRHQVVGILEKAYGCPLDQVFSEFDASPIGSASIGQVHKAKLRKGGKVVAVKVQCPEAERLFRSDIHTARGFARLFAPEQVIVFDEIEAQFTQEFDYVKEAMQLELMHHNVITNGGFGRSVVIPRLVSE